MTPDRTDETPDEGTEHGVLDDTGTLDTASITVLGGHISQVSVDLPATDDDEVDDDVVEDEMPVIDAESRAFEVVGIVHLPDADVPPLLTHVPDPEVAAAASDPGLEELPTGDIILEPHPETLDGDGEPEIHDAEIVPDDGEIIDDAADDSVGDPVTGSEESAVAVPDDGDGGETDPDPAPEEDETPPEAGTFADAESAPEAPAADADATDVPADDADASRPEEAAQPAASEETTDAEDTIDEVSGHEPAADAEQMDEILPSEGTGHEAEDVVPTEPEREIDAPAGDSADAVAAPATPLAARAPTPAQEAPVAREVSAASEAPAVPDATTAPETGPVPRTRAERAATGTIGTIPLTRREIHQADEAARAGRMHANERVRTPGGEVALTSKRLGEIDDTRESPDLLTADRLLDPRQVARPEPEGLWQQLVYSVSRHRINLGDGRRARARKDLDRRIATPLSGEARFVPVLSRKGGVGKTTVTSLLGMALADARDDRVIAVDANPDRGTLADRVGGANGRTVRDLVRAHDQVEGYGDVSSIVARDTTRLDVLASDSDPKVSEAFSDEDYRRVADIAAHYYSIVLTDTGTGIVHSVMEATLELADSLVVVAGLSVDEARLASETLTWLETNGYADRVRNAVVVLNNARPGAPLVRESELEAHFRTRVRAVIRMPYDAHVASGSAITFRDLQPGTRQAARELAAAVVEGLRTPVAAA
ncbi:MULTISPECIES: nucleotide-binding protein [Microbacterium]|uniref:MinD/ParA family protein n=1 Tax=Microbacterium mcarthurae TaxID=3035918 RepID=A0ABW9GIU0_9MICO|nr:MinD/ParA family protein [Microbacterium sp. ACRRU]MCG7417017.1 MinD/ParA family protein [Microbacterium sp. ACRRU]